jgi:hypothetical protein
MSFPSFFNVNWSSLWWHWKCFYGLIQVRALSTTVSSTNGRSVHIMQ